MNVEGVYDPESDWLNSVPLPPPAEVLTEETAKEDDNVVEHLPEHRPSSFR